MDAKSNEIPALRDLLAGFDLADLHGCVITADAMHTQADTAQAVLDAGADYVLTVKGLFVFEGGVRATRRGAR